MTKVKARILDEPGLNRIIRAGYKILNLQTYFTAGPKETRAWTVRVGAKAPEAAIARPAAMMSLVAFMMFTFQLRITALVLRTPVNLGGVGGNPSVRRMRGIRRDCGVAQ